MRAADLAPACQLMAFLLAVMRDPSMDAEVRDSAAFLALWTSTHISEALAKLVPARERTLP